MSSPVEIVDLDDAELRAARQRHARSEAEAERRAHARARAGLVRIDRCGTCGAWRWDAVCRTCRPPR